MQKVSTVLSKNFSKNQEKLMVTNNLLKVCVVKIKQFLIARKYLPNKLIQNEKSTLRNIFSKEIVNV